MFDRMSASLLTYLRDTQGRVVQSVLSVINVALMESTEREAPSQRVLALFDDDAMQSITTSLLAHSSAIVRGKATVMLVLLMQARPLVLLPMFSKKLAHGLEKAGKDTDPYVAAAASAFASAVDEFISPSLAVLQKEVTCARSVIVSCMHPHAAAGLAARSAGQPRRRHMLPAQAPLRNQPQPRAVRAQDGGGRRVCHAEAATRRLRGAVC